MDTIAIIPIEDLNLYGFPPEAHVHYKSNRMALLVDSIRREGITAPFVITSDMKIICGSNRWVVMSNEWKFNGDERFKEVPCVFVDPEIEKNPSALLQLALADNLSHKHNSNEEIINAVYLWKLQREESKSIWDDPEKGPKIAEVHRLRDEENKTQQEIADITGIPQRTVSRWLSLAKISDESSEKMAKDNFIFHEYDYEHDWNKYYFHLWYFYAVNGKKEGEQVYSTHAYGLIFPANELKEVTKAELEPYPNAIEMPPLDAIRALLKRYEVDHTDIRKDSRPPDWMQTVRGLHINTFLDYELERERPEDVAIKIYMEAIAPAIEKAKLHKELDGHYRLVIFMLPGRGE